MNIGISGSSPRERSSSSSPSSSLKKYILCFPKYPPKTTIWFDIETATKWVVRAIFSFRSRVFHSSEGVLSHSIEFNSFRYPWLPPKQYAVSEGRTTLPGQSRAALRGGRSLQEFLGSEYCSLTFRKFRYPNEPPRAIIWEERPLSVAAIQRLFIEWSSVLRPEQSMEKNCDVLQYFLPLYP